MFCYPFRCYAQNVTLTIEAWDKQQHCNDHEIDTIHLTIFLSDTDQQQIFQLQETGLTGIGVFNFSYHVLNVVNKYEECFTEIPSLDTSTCTDDSESMIESTPPWLWIAVAIVFMLVSILLFLAGTVLACIVKQKDKDLKLLKYQHRNASGANRKFYLF